MPPQPGPWPWMPGDCLQTVVPCLTYCLGKPGRRSGTQGGEGQSAFFSQRSKSKTELSNIHFQKGPLGAGILLGTFHFDLYNDEYSHSTHTHTHTHTHTLLPSPPLLRKWVKTKWSSRKVSEPTLLSLQDNLHIYKQLFHHLTTLLILFCSPLL